MPRHIVNRVLGLSAFVALLFDILFWQQPLGINFPLYVLLFVGGGLLSLLWQGERPAPGAGFLILLSVALALGVALRAEPLSQFLGVVTPLLLLAILAASSASGEWAGYLFRDYIERGVRLILDALTGLLTAMRLMPEETKASNSSPSKIIWALLRGLLLAAPVLLVFSSLLASADPVFEGWVSAALQWLDLERLPEYIFRMVYISTGAYLLGGILLSMAARRKAASSTRPREAAPVLSLLGAIEANTVLALVDALFLVFVVIQFKYFFGGRQNVHISGYTYSEYARRGFAELVAVAVFSLLLIIALSSLTTLRSGRPRAAFTGLNVALVVLLAVILTSSAQRLALYEEAYGFTRLRTYTHVFIIWLGLLLLALALFEVLQRTRYLALACLSAGIGFSISLLALNVDAFIVRMNVARVQSGQPLDVAYLASLSEDALPELVRQWSAANTDQKPVLAAALACHAILHDQYEQDTGWRGFHFSAARANQVWQALPESQELAAAILTEDDSKFGWHYVVLEGQPVYCEALGGWD